MSKEIQIFNNEQFGKIRMIKIDDKPYFVATDIAKALGYKDTTNAIKQHCRWVVKHKVPHPQSKNKTLEVNVIPEGDMYRLITNSELPSAEKFESWVFDEVLPQIRKTGSYQIPKMSKELQAIFMMDSKQQQMDARITKLENNTTIDYSQQEELRNLGTKKVVAILGGSDAPAYKELNKKVFSSFWRDYKRKLNVNSYKNTLVKDFEIGRQAIINWTPSKEIKFMIDGCNAQMRI